ncbi:hypothetical protein D7X74_16755 [Corallococcus sp. CA047B]|uniref:hypothetical protein n=1 Tax=Corallococcus sp. CA047B TaxID=2316729 RepID=UPI000EA0B892|nr:hypothetical protein [Corallococcus sp. CA047B]RKH16017.1 hypothetical protein D7X74_16755 [Corallococcus sp. CA047B]
MRLKYLTTKISLPPIVPSEAAVRAFLKSAFEEYRWFEPARSHNEQIDPRRIDYDTLVAGFLEFRSLMVLAKTDRDFFLFSARKADGPPHVGKLTWDAALSRAKNAKWRDDHVHQVTALMKLFNSPLAVSATSEDEGRKCQQFIPSPSGIGQRWTWTVRDPSEGLAGVFWRNFYGPPFIEMFGDRLNAVPETQRRTVADGIVLVEPYTLPTDAMTPAAEAAEQQLREVLGPECFYDQVARTMPRRVPDLPHPGALSS